MDIKQLKYLVALDQTRNFGLAAERCHVTQPTLSMRLRNLEAELGLLLVRRGQRFEGFTTEGERILAWARSLLAAHDGLYAEASSCRGHLIGTLRLGLVPLGGVDPMAMIGLFARVHPKLRFQLFAMSSETIVEGLDSNQLDLGLAYLQGSERERFECLALGNSGIGVLHDSRHFNIDRPELEWPDVAALPLGLLSSGMHFRQSVDHGLYSHGLRSDALLETDAVHSLLQAVSAGLCCALVPLESGLAGDSPHLRLTPIRGGDTLAPLSLLMRRSAPRSPLAEACFSAASELSLWRA